MKAVKTVLLGLGYMGRNHLQALSSHPGFDLSYVLEPSDLSDDIIPDGCTHIRSLNELDDPMLACAVVATPTETHYQVGKALLEKNLSVLMEKPAATTSAEARDLVALAGMRDVKLAAGNIERCNPAVSLLVDVINSGILGRLVHIRAQRAGRFPGAVKPGNDVVLDLAVHDFDILRMLLGPLQLNSALGAMAKLDGIYDSAEFTFTADGNIFGSVKVNWLTPQKARSITVTGSEGNCTIDLINQTCDIFGLDIDGAACEILRGKHDVQKSQTDTHTQLHIKAPRNKALEIQLTEFYRYLNGQATRLATDQGLIESVEMVEKAGVLLRSSRN